MKYIISDIHGEYNKFIRMLELINFSSNDTMLILGDVIDRGKKSIDTLLHVMNSSNMELLLGNHEDMALKSLIDKETGYYNCWMGNGGYSTLQQFDNLSIHKRHTILNYLQNCELYKIVDNYIFVHAGINTSIKFSNIKSFMEEQDTETLLWDRMEGGVSGIKGYTIISGHTPTKYFHNITPMTIWNNKDRIVIDCGACFKGGQLSCLRLDDMKEFYI